MLLLVLEGLLKRQTVFRTLFEYQLRLLKPSTGTVIDLGGVKNPFPGYARSLKASSELITTVNLSATVQADVVGDAGATGLPSASADEVWAFNLLEHVEYPERVLAEARRLAKPGARFISGTPFLLGIHGEPDDFARYSKSKHVGLLRDAGFTDIRVTALGMGPMLAGAAQAQPLLPWFLSIPWIAFTWLLDKGIFALRPQWRDKWPLGYLVEATAL